MPWNRREVLGDWFFWVIGNGAEFALWDGRKNFVRNAQISNSIEVGFSFQLGNRRMVWSDVFAVMTTRKKNRNGLKVESTSCCISSFGLHFSFNQRFEVWICCFAANWKFVWVGCLLASRRLILRDQNGWPWLEYIGTMKAVSLERMLKLPHLNKAWRSRMREMTSPSVSVESRGWSTWIFLNIPWWLAEGRRRTPASVVFLEA